MNINHNIFTFHKHENQIDIKTHTVPAVRGEIKQNVCYGKHCNFATLNLQDGAEDLDIHNNLIIDSNAASHIVRIEGQGGNIDDIEFVGNWVISNSGASLNGIRFAVDTTETISNVWVLNNVIEGNIPTAIRANDPTAYTNIVITNNILRPTTTAVTENAAAVDGDTNMYIGVSAWSDDASPINASLSDVKYVASPVGALAADSEGIDDGTIVAGHDYGNDLGIPSTFENPMELEFDILNRLLQTFTMEDIQAVYTQGELFHLHNRTYSACLT